MKYLASSESAQLLGITYFIAGLLQRDEWVFNRILMWSLAAFWFIQAIKRIWKEGV